LKNKENADEGRENGDAHAGHCPSLRGAMRGKDHLTTHEDDTWTGTL